MKKILLLVALLLTTVVSAQVSAGPVPDYVACDDASNDGIEDFDFSVWDAPALGNQNPATHTVSYFESQFDAVNNLNALPVVYANVTNPQIIFIRVDDTASGNFNITTGDLIVESLPVINNPQTYTFCGVINAAGQVQVDLFQIEPFLSNGQNNLLFTYYTSQQDADNDTNPISTTFIGTANQPTDIFIRAQTTLNCFTTIVVSANFVDCNQQSQVVDLESCADQNGTACFDLNVNDFPALGTNSPNTHAVSYHLTQVDADNGTNALQPTYCASSDTQVFVRVEEIASGIADTSQSFMVIVHPQMPIYTLSALMSCDDDNDGEIVWNSNSIFTEILNISGTPGGTLGINFFASQQDAQTGFPVLGYGTSFITDTANTPATMFVRTINYDTDCLSISPVQLLIDPNCFTYGYPAPLEECVDSNTGLACFDLTANDSLLLAGNNPADYIITYHTSQADGTSNTNPIANANNYCIANTVQIFARIEEIATGSNQVLLFTAFVTQATLDTTTLNSFTDCDADLDGIVNFDLTTFATQLNTSNALAYYANVNNAQDEILPITTPSNINIPVTSGAYPVFVRETIPNGCDIIYETEVIPVANCNNSYLCDNALSLCDRIGQPFVNIYDNSTAEPGNYYPFSSAFGGPRNPSWFYIPIESSGDLTVEVYQNTQPDFLGQDLDIDFVIYGPFTTATGGCANGITQANYVDHSFSVQMPEIGQIDNAQAGEYYLLLTSNFTSQPGFLKVEIGAASTATVNCDGIRMQSMLDVNLNGVVDASDVPFPLGIFDWEKNMSGNVMQVVTPESAYSIYDSDPANSYDLGYNVLPAYTANYSVAPATYANQTIPAGSGITTRDFLVTPLSAYEDVVVYIIPQEQPRPGFTYKETVVYANLGTTPVAVGQLQFTYDSQLSIVAVDDPAAIIGATSVDLNYSNLLPFEYRTMEIEMQIPTIPTINLGDLLTNTASITPVANDITPNNNTNVSSQIVIGSYDPNDKMESRGEFINPAEFGPNDYFYYTIRFENTGTASAINVRVEDTLDAQLDWSSLEMINASHSYVMEQMEEQVVWRFDNILLPDSTTDPVGANGYIYFKVKPLASSEGTVIPNTAEIYFDFNPPIITNTFTSTFRTPLSIDTPEVVDFNLIPNPTSGIVQVNLQNAILDNAELVLYDVRGRITLSRKLTNNTPQVDLTDLPAGIYIAELRNGDAVYTSKVVKQ